MSPTIIVPIRRENGKRQERKPIFSEWEVEETLILVIPATELNTRSKCTLRYIVDKLSPLPHPFRNRTTFPTLSSARSCQALFKGELPCPSFTKAPTASEFTSRGTYVRCLNTLTKHQHVKCKLVKMFWKKCSFFQCLNTLCRQDFRNLRSFKIMTTVPTIFFCPTTVLKISKES